MSADSEVLSAGARVGHILELLEAILLEVDIRTLLVSAQRVNKRWWNVIGNPNFQKRLFFIPDPDATGPIDNPFLAEYFPFCFPAPGYPPCIAKDRTPPVHDYWNDKPRNLTSEECAPIMDRAEAFSREDASWRRMYTHQPPLLGVQRMWENALGVSWRRFEYVPSETTHTDTNVTMSMVIEYFFRADKAIHSNWLQACPRGIKIYTSVSRRDFDRWKKYYSGLTPHGGEIYVCHHYNREPTDGPCPKFSTLGKILLPPRSFKANCLLYLKMYSDWPRQFWRDMLYKPLHDRWQRNNRRRDGENFEVTLREKYFDLWLDFLLPRIIVPICRWRGMRLNQEVLWTPFRSMA